MPAPLQRSEATIVRHCPGCLTERCSALGTQESWSWVRCDSCGTAYVRDEVTQAQLSDFYAGYYDEDTPTIPPVVADRVTEIVDTFTPFRQTGRLLDIGFGGGTLLTAAAAADWECWGTEVSTSATATADPAWTIALGDVPSLELPAAGFDVVCMVELLEHVTNPLDQLRAAARLLRPGGLLFGTTPSARGVSGRLLGVRWSAFTAPEHLQLFTRTGLRAAMLASGFTSATVTSRGVNPHELVNGLRHRDIRPDERVQSAYRLQEQLQRSGGGRLLRSTTNSALQALRLGDSLKLRALA